MTPKTKRQRLADELSRQTGKLFLPENIHLPRGWYRTSRRGSNDSYRWEAFPADRAGWSIGSYATITECLKKGFFIDSDLREAFANDA